MGIEPLDCKRKNDELICPIKKTLLECYSSLFIEDEMNKILLIYYFNEKGESEQFFLIGDITCNFNVQKKDVYVKITKLLTHNIETDNFIAYETNVTNIPSILGFAFYLNFTGKEESSLNSSCILRKGEYNPLLILCLGEYEDVLSLKEIENEIRLNYINAKYNFIIQPVKNTETITIINSTIPLPYFYVIYPNILNFNVKSSFEIDLFLGRYDPNLKPLDGITFNEKEKDLECIDLKYKIKCNVSKEHFKGLNNEYYYIKYNNHNFKIIKLHHFLLIQ